MELLLLLLGASGEDRVIGACCDAIDDCCCDGATLVGEGRAAAEAGERKELDLGTR